jgi:hypothetical protein
VGLFVRWDWQAAGSDFGRVELGGSANLALLSGAAPNIAPSRNWNNSA